MKVYIKNGLLEFGYEPHAHPGAFLLTWFNVVDSLGQTPSEKINWDGPGIWIDSKEGVPKGHRALWLGTENTSRPHIVYVADEPAPRSDVYRKWYLKGFTIKGSYPKLPETLGEFERSAVGDGWEANPFRKRRAY